MKPILLLRARPNWSAGQDSTCRSFGTPVERAQVSRQSDELVRGLGTHPARLNFVDWPIMQMPSWQAVKPPPTKHVLRKYTRHLLSVPLTGACDFGLPRIPGLRADPGSQPRGSLGSAMRRGSCRTNGLARTPATEENTPDVGEYPPCAPLPVRV